MNLSLLNSTEAETLGFADDPANALLNSDAWSRF
jgi:hypothetical protein